MFEIVILSPEAIPLRLGGTDPMIELVFGETNMPHPIPKTARAIKTSEGLEFIPVKVNIKNAQAVTPRPTIVKNLDPYLSESLPQTGPSTTKVASKARSDSPVCSAVSPSTTWR